MNTPGTERPSPSYPRKRVPGRAAGLGSRIRGSDDKDSGYPSAGMRTFRARGPTR